MDAISAAKFSAYNTLKNMQVEAKDLREKLDQLNREKVEKAQQLKEESLKRYHKEVDRYDFEV